MDETQKIVRTAVIIVVVVGIGFGIYYLLSHRPAKHPASSQKAPIEAPSIPAEKPGAEEEKEAFKLPPVELDKSDDLLRRLAQELSSHPRLSAWLKSKDLIRKFVAAVDNIANGQSPKTQIDFFVPPGRFEVAKRDGRLFIDPRNSERYNLVSDVFISLDTKSCLRLFRGLKPLFQDAYKDLGYPTEDFKDTLIRAIEELLRVPAVDGPIELEKKVVSYRIVDEELEGLTPAQKQFFRMGPENVQVIQTKLREIAIGLGLTKDQLPRPWIYRPRSY